MKQAGITQYRDFREGQILRERMNGGHSRYRTILCKGIYTDESGTYFAGFAYVDPKATKQNKKITVSGKSPMWFEKI